MAVLVEEVVRTRQCSSKTNPNDAVDESEERVFHKRLLWRKEQVRDETNWTTVGASSKQH